MQQKYLEQTWFKLESVLGPENGRTQSHRISKRMINTSRTQTSRCTSAYYKPINPCITIPQLKKIYNAKCIDMDIPVLPDQESRFITYCLNNFKNRQFLMKECGLGSKSAATIGKVLKNSNFAYINLSKNSLGDEGIYLLLKEICDSPTIVHVDVSNNDITTDGFEKIGKILEYHPSIISFDGSSYEGLHRNRLNAEGAVSLCTALKKNVILQFLSLSGISLGDSIECLADGLSSNTSLVSIDLSNNGIAGRCIESLSKAIIKSELKDLNLSNNKIGDEGCEFIGNMIVGAYDSGCPLVKLNLSTNNITSKGCAKLFHSLRMNNTIKYFNASGNHFNQGLSLYFSSFLSDNCALVTLNLSGCSLKPEALENVHEGLSKNKKLENLILSCNKIEDEGLKNLASGLTKNQCLKLIDLSNCNIKAQGSCFLANSLRSNFTIETINLKDNSVKDEAGELFVELTRTNKNLLSVCLDLNPLNLKYVAGIKSNLKDNRKLFKKQIIPKIKNEIEKIKAPLESYESINRNIQNKLKQKTVIELKHELKNESLEEIKEKEEKKLTIMQEEHKSLRQKNLELSKSIECYQTETIVFYI